MARGEHAVGAHAWRDLLRERRAVAVEEGVEGGARRLGGEEVVGVVAGRVRWWSAKGLVTERRGRVRARGESVPVCVGHGGHGGL